MKTLLLALSMAIAGATLAFAPSDADAQRLGRGRPAGMQRQAPPPQQAVPPQQQQQTPANPSNATPATGAGATAAAAAPRRSWLGPIAGLAAGLGIAALLSHFGLGGAFANFMTIALLVLVAFFVIRWLMRRFAGGAARSAPGMQFAGAGAPGGPAPLKAMPAPMERVSHGLTPSAGAAAVPAGFDTPAFERIAKMIFIRMQAANDASNVEDLRKFTTPELFASLRLDLQERGDKAQQTDVVQLDADVLEAVQEDGQQIVTVRFKGLLRERAEAPAEPFDELWHFVKPADGSREWSVAGIQPAA